MAPETLFVSPFRSIALCLSGGGYRAATFALGTIDMLDELDMLKDVKLLSTVSGGTFTGVTYAAWMSEGKSYGEFYRDLYEFLKNTNCIDQALDGLYTTPPPSGVKNLSLIRAAAAVYDRELFKGRRFSSLIGEVGNEKRFLELIHNATEFRRGNSFRFRASHRPLVSSGNGDFQVAMDIAGELRLADVVAASSCFPAAFEPLRFPEDFCWDSGLADIRGRLVKGVHGHASGFEDQDGHCISVPLMDGGIYDNQGITNAQMADDDANIFDMYIVCDTTTRNDDMLTYDNPANPAGWVTIDKLVWGAALLFVFAAISAVMLIGQLWTDLGILPWYQTLFRSIVPIALLLVLTGALGWAYRLLRKNKTLVIMGQEFALWDVIKRMTPADAIEIAKARISSLTTMSNNIFMKRIRGLQFRNVMGDPKYRHMVAFDIIYEIYNSSYYSDIFALDANLKPTEMMRTISENSEKVVTALWFETKEEQDRLVVCGQMTTCFSLLENLWRRWQTDRKIAKDKQLPEPPKPNDPASPHYELYQKLLAQWKAFKAEPYRLLDRPRR